MDFFVVLKIALVLKRNRGRRPPWTIRSEHDTTGCLPCSSGYVLEIKNYLCSFI